MARNQARVKARAGDNAMGVGQKTRLYLITDRHAAMPGSCGGDYGRRLCAAVRAALAAVPPGGAMVQVRDKDLPVRDRIALARSLAGVCRPRKCPLLVNDRLDVAMACGADGVHLPERSLDIASVRALCGPSWLIGASAHSPESAAQRALEGADLVVLGPIWPTPSKRAYGPALGTEALEVAARSTAGANAALFAIGGVAGPERARVAASCGARGIAAIRAFFAAPDPGQAAAAMYAAIA